LAWLCAVKCPGAGQEVYSISPDSKVKAGCSSLIKSLALAMAASLRPSPKTYLIIFLALSFLSGVNAYGGSSDFSLREKDVDRAESIVGKLRRLEQSRTESADLRSQRKLFEKMYPGLFIQVAELRAGDLKTDLTTAIFLDEEAWREMFESNSAEPDCKDELREVYAKLCVENQGGTVANFLRAKARLHTRWAEALINDYHGIKDAATTATLAEMRRERRNDLVLAKQAVTALKSLEKKVCDYSSLAEFEEHQRLARVPFERLSEDVAGMLQSVDRVLLSLPRSPLFYSLYHARNSYVDGLFWWQKTYRRSQLVVDVNSFNEPDETHVSKLDANVVNYTAAINWRKAIKHTREAVNMIEALKI
jgi:hypothetical protein